MRGLFRLCFAIGAGLLAAGLVLYVRLALYREGQMLWVFACCMGCLLFFNLPTVIQRRIDRRKQATNPQDDARS